MPLSTRIHETDLRVRYAETDAAGIAHHSSFVAWLEVGRVEWMRAGGATYAELESEGYQLPVIDMHLRYVGAARFDDQIRVRTGLTDVRSRTLTFVYEILTAEPRPRQLANGRTRHICVAGGRVVTLPASLRQMVEEN